MISSGPIHVLLVEDNEDQVRLLRQLIERPEAGTFRLVVTGSLAQALAILTRGGIDLILLDLTLPDSSGLDTFVRVIEAAPEVPLVVMSGVQDVALAVETLQLGAQDYLVKGHVDNHLLVRSLQYAVERKRAQSLLKRANETLEQRVRERTLALQQSNARLEDELAERRKAELAVVESNRQLAAALAQLQASQQEVIQRERLHALGRMANGIAHDFNNSLAPILGFSEILLVKPEILQDPARALGYVQMIHEAAQDSARVVARLGEFYRYREEGEVFMPVVINDLVRQAIALTQPRWKDQALAAGVTIEIRTEFGEVPTVRGNERELRDALVNLIFNAVDAIPRRGTVTLRTAVEGCWLAVSVSDDGIGMSDELKARCLEPFFTTKESDSLGLGLGSVYGIVRRHDGELDIQTEAGRGTTVSLLLPLESASQPAPPAPAPGAGPALRILVVEDEPLVREVLSIYLAEDQHEVVLAENGRIGLEKFQQEGPFDLVLTDRAMPDLHGDALAREIKKLRADQPVVLLTGFGDLMTGAGEQPEGIDLVVPKPFTMATLRTAIAQVTTRGKSAPGPSDRPPH